jgi:F-type H+-transporting ATPase subunit epsilon
MANAPTSAPTGRLRLDLVTLDREVLSSECDEVVLPGSKGEFGVLPGHAALVATLDIGVMRVRDGAKTRVFALSGGFCEVRSNVVTVLADQAEAPEQIDVEATKAAMAAAEKLVVAAQDESYRDSMRTIELCRARLATAGR